MKKQVLKYLEKNSRNACYAQKMITVVIETFARCQLYRLIWP